MVYNNNIFFYFKPKAYKLEFKNTSATLSTLWQAKKNSKTPNVILLIPYQPKTRLTETVVKASVLPPSSFNIGGGGSEENNEANNREDKGKGRATQQQVEEWTAEEEEREESEEELSYQEKELLRVRRLVNAFNSALRSSRYEEEHRVSSSEKLTNDMERLNRKRNPESFLDKEGAYFEKYYNKKLKDASDRALMPSPEALGEVPRSQMSKEELQAYKDKMRAEIDANKKETDNKNNNKEKIKIKKIKLMMSITIMMIMVMKIIIITRIVKIMVTIMEVMKTITRTILKTTILILTKLEIYVLKWVQEILY